MATPFASEKATAQPAPVSDSSAIVAEHPDPAEKEDVRVITVAAAAVRVWGEVAQDRSEQ